MEENSTFNTITVVLGAVIGVILLGIIGVTIYGAMNASRQRVERATTESVSTEAGEAAETDMAQTEEAAVDGEGAVEAGEAIAEESVAEAEGEEATAEGDAEEAAAEEVTSDQAEAPAEVEAAEETAATTIAAALPEPVPQAPVHVVDAFNKGGCAGCHVIPGIPGANGQLGPNLTTIGVDGATRINGYLAVDYITESILDPNTFIAPECPTGPCPANVMLQSFADTLNDDDLTTIVGYLSTLGTEDEVALSVVEQLPVTLDAAMPAESVLEPFMPLPKEPADPAMVALGKYLFYDQRLSGNNSLSCASCHHPDKAYTDGEPLSRGYPSTMLFRNTPTLLNTVYADYLYRDGRMDGNDLPTTVRDHIAEAHFMSMDGRLMVERINQVPAYVDLYQAAFGGEPSYGKTLNAIAAYVRTLNSPPTPYDLYVAGDESALSEEAIAGLELFQGKAGCTDCHSGELLTDEGFHNTGVGTDLALFEEPERHLTFRRFFRTLGTPNYRALNEDVGRFALTLDQEDRGAFNTPSLREVDRTAPYMHDGSMATLEEVVAFYNAGGGESETAGLEPLDLTDEEVGQLVVFLESLSSEPLEVAAPELPGYQVVPLGDGTAVAAVPAADSDAAADTTGEEVVAEIEEAATVIEEASAEIEEASAEIEEATAAIEEASAAIEEATIDIEETVEIVAEEPAEEAGVEAAPEEESATPPEPVEVTPELVAAFTKGTCNACHVVPDIPGAVGMIGPDMTEIGLIGATRVDGLSAEEYIRQSIVEPMAYIVPDCPLGPCTPGVMPANIVNMISEDELDMIVNYLASLGHGG